MQENLPTGRFFAFIFDPEGTIKKSKTLSPWLKKIEHII